MILINADHIKKRLISCTLPTEKSVRLVGGGRVFKAAATTTKRVTVTAGQEFPFDVGHMTLEYRVTQ